MAMRNDGENRTKMERLPPIARAHLQRQPTSDHPDADLLTSFAEQSLPAHERQQVLEHLSRCAQCREVAVLAGAEPEDAALREPEYELVAAAAPATVPSPVSHARAKAPAPTRRLWLSGAPVRWLALAACVAICATVVVRYPTPWRGKPKAEPTTKNIPLDQLAADRPVNDASDRFAPANVPPVEKKVASGAKPEPVARPSSAAPKTTQITPAVPSAAPASDRGPQLAKKVDAPRAIFTPRLAAPSAAAPVGAIQTPEGHAGRAGSGTARAATRAAPSGMIGGTIASSAARAEQHGRAGYGLAQRAPQESARGAANAGAVQTQWSLSEDGLPQRSDDSGHTWQKFRVDASAQFRALYGDRQEVWVGGAAGILYHSSDAGGHWTRVLPTDGDAKLSADITRIDFTSVLRGDITSAKGEIWSTYDGGTTWVQH
jgi:Photosynthesis system II assembly factor YCF48